MEERIKATGGAQDTSERAAFFDWLDDAAAQNAAHLARQDIGLSDEEVLAITEEARNEAAAESDEGAGA